MSKSIKKILVANRGEIALRIMRTAQEMDISTVAVYSDFDKTARHTLFADEAINIGKSPASESYLNMDAIIDAAIHTNSDAIHPGYGFLSENAEFAQKVVDSNLIFIGPKPHAIRVMGDKLASKATVKDFNVPLVPGLENAITDVSAARKYAAQIGYPVLIKASAGGGGKGMRIVHSSDQLEEQMEAAIREATSAFGNGSVFVEKYILEPKHIEFQILRDSHGNGIHLFERECSIQRRYQKVLEEAPSMTLDEKLREEMGKAALLVADSCDYIGAGTIEFIVDKERKFYFLEMNTRLQVEHPVTEMITGIDLVREQIRIAEEKVLSIKQQDLSINGHAFEMRVYAENPRNNFLPETGTLQTYRIPSGPGVRVDDGCEEGSEIPIYYDPMIAKLVTWASDRNLAIARMKRAINEYEIHGVGTSLPFGLFVLDHDEFISGDFTTSFVEQYWDPSLLDDVSNSESIAALLASELLNASNAEKMNGTQAQAIATGAWRKNRKDA